MKPVIIVQAVGPQLIRSADSLSSDALRLTGWHLVTTSTHVSPTETVTSEFRFRRPSLAGGTWDRMVIHLVETAWGFYHAGFTLRIGRRAKSKRKVALPRHVFGPPAIINETMWDEPAANAIVLHLLLQAHLPPVPSSTTEVP